MEEARKLMLAADGAVDLAKRTARGEIGELSIGFLVWGMDAFFPRMIRGFRELYPGIHLTLLESALAEERFVVCDRIVARVLFDKIHLLCAQAGFAPRITQTSKLIPSVLTLIRAGEGVTLIGATLQHGSFLRPGLLSAYDAQGISRVIHRLVSRSNGYRSEGVSGFHS